MFGGTGCAPGVRIMSRRSTLVVAGLTVLALQTACTTRPLDSPAASPAASPAPSPAAVAPSPSAVGASTAPSSGAAPTATAVAAPEVVWIGNTDGSGVYLRNSPHDGDRGDVLPDGTQVTITGEQLEGDGKTWYPVSTENAGDGYVQVEYVTRTEPTGTPAPPVGAPK